MMHAPEILIIDDEPQVRSLLHITLKSHGYHTREAINGKEGLIQAGNHPPALILLDLGLPDMHGSEVLKRLRKWFTSPVIILSVNKAEEDIIQALDEGANDYLSKPFRTGELLARIRAALRQTPDEKEQVVVAGPLRVDLIARSVHKDETLVKLTSTEYSLLSLLAANEGKVLTHQYLLRSIWGPGYIHQQQYLRVYIAQIRKKIEDDPNDPKFIITESGVGYRFLVAGGG